MASVRLESTSISPSSDAYEGLGFVALSGSTVNSSVRNGVDWLLSLDNQVSAQFAVKWLQEWVLNSIDGTHTSLSVSLETSVDEVKAVIGDLSELVAVQVKRAINDIVADFFAVLASEWKLARDHEVDNSTE